jgi:hypothetical protein
METYQLAVEYRSQWSWQDTEWLTLFIAQVWSRTHQFPRTRQELDAVNYEEIQQDFERFKKGEFTVQPRGITLEEGWIAVTLLTRQFHMCFRNAKEYWPPDRIPQSFKTDLLPADIWGYVYHSFKHHREQVANLSFAELKGLPNPSGTLGVFLGNCAHAVMVIGILPDEERIIFYDPWQRGNTRSLLSKGKNAAGIKAVRMNKHDWSINKQEFTNSVLSFVTPKASYDYYSNKVRSRVYVGS